MSTATKSNGSALAAKPQAFNGYADIMAFVNAPVEDRKTLAIGRQGAKVCPRRFHLLADDIAALRDLYNKGDKCPNPQNKGAYWGFIEALKALGINKAHSYGECKKAMKAAMTAEGDGELWDRFANHKGESENALDLDGRIRQNAEVLQRLGGFTPYGLKLLQVGQAVLKTKGVVVDILKSKTGDMQFRLNTNSAEPQNDFHRRRSVETPQTRAKALRLARADTVERVLKAEQPKAKPQTDSKAAKASKALEAAVVKAREVGKAAKAKATAKPKQTNGKAKNGNGK
jgi:hypothetical protein